MKKQYHSLYLLKALGALFVLMIHFGLPGTQMLEPFYRSGVPLFFIISGFFLYDADETRQRMRFTRGIGKLVRLVLFFNIVYLIAYIVAEGHSPLNGWTDLLRLVVYGDSVSGHLWFLTSYLWTLVLMLFCKSLQIRDSWLYALAAVWGLSGLAEEQYAWLTGVSGRISQDFWLPSLSCSLPMMMAGYAIRKHEANITEWMNGKRYRMLMEGGVILLLPYIEHRLLCWAGHYSGAFMLTTYMQTIAFFVLALSRPSLVRDSWIETIGRNHSGNIYYWQFLPYMLIVAPLVPAAILEQFSLAIMIPVLLVWSWGANWIKKSVSSILPHKS